jgi:hypothetical protein
MPAWPCGVSERDEPPVHGESPQFDAEPGTFLVREGGADFGEREGGGHREGRA